MKGHFVLFPHENVWYQNLKSKNKGAHATLSHTYPIKHAPFLLPNHQLFSEKEWGFLSPYQWCSALRSSPGCIHTCHPGRSRAHCSVGDTPADHRLCPSSPPRSGRCPRHKRRVLRSPLHKSLWERRQRTGGDRGGEREGRGWKSRVLLLRKADTLHYLALRGNEWNS